MWFYAYVAAVCLVAVPLLRKPRPEEVEPVRCTCHQGSKCAYCMMREGSL